MCFSMFFCKNLISTSYPFDFSYSDVIVKLFSKTFIFHNCCCSYAFYYTYINKKDFAKIKYNKLKLKVCVSVDSW